VKSLTHSDVERRNHRRKIHLDGEVLVPSQRDDVLGQDIRRSGDAKSNGAASNPLPLPSLPKGGGAIRDMGEKFNANPATGSASVTVPLFTSPGRNGFHPQLQLTYDSSSGNGPFGFGWSLSEQAISRRTDKGLPRYFDDDESDTFILSGAEDLVPVLDANDTHPIAGQRVDRFRPRVEGLYARIERWTDEKSGVAYWRSISRDNVTSIFGQSAEARIADPENPGRIFKWLLEKSTDGKGNIIRYRYKAENLDGIDQRRPSEQNRRFANQYLKRILYGNEIPDDEPSFFFETVFDYGEHVTDQSDEKARWALRPDAFSTFRATFEIRTYRRCQRVLMFHRFPELGSEPVLVRSTAFHYEGDEAATFIRQIVQTGYDPTNMAEPVKTLPPLLFEYSKAEIDDTIRTLRSPSYEHVPGGIDGHQYRFLDFDSEGLPGILIEQPQAWFYKRNLGGGAFDASSRVAQWPVGGSLAGGIAELTDLAGDGLKYLVRHRETPAGYFRRNEDQSWAPFVTFETLPRIRWDDPELRFIDVDGDGLPDLLIGEDEAFRWYPSRGVAGFGGPERAPKPRDEEKGPRLVFAEEYETIFLADMSGDGLTDLVRIRNGEVCYWPNIGYGRFGAKVTMDRAPRFDSFQKFDSKRLRLADVDGSGTTDILYLGEERVRIWFNQSGNSFREAPALEDFPTADDLERVSVVDLLGKGTACLVWSSPLASQKHAPIRYVDLMASGKPHLMTKMDNGLGMITRVEYAPSTQFYLDDRRAGPPWVTKLPFPVHCVARVVTTEAVTGTTLVQHYRYHHGFYDGVEREFRGFGMVEQEDTESFAAYQLTAKGNVIEQDLHNPVVLTRTWFHTGAFLEGDKISHQFSHEYYQGDANLVALPDTSLPAGLTAAEAREALRALRGHMLRQEVYALDGSSDPYAVTEQNFTLEKLQPMGKRHAVFCVHPRETVALHYERNPKDPRVTHDLTLKVDKFGNVRQSASIAYCRRSFQGNAQDNLLATCTEQEVFNEPNQADWYRVGVPYETRKYQLHGIPATSGLLAFIDVEGFVNKSKSAPFDAAPGGGPLKRLIEHSRQLYWSDDLAAALPLGNAGQRALPHESYRMAFTPGLLAAYGVRVKIQDLDDEKYQIDADGNWWSRSGVQFFSKDLFYQPTHYTDPFGHTTSMEYEHALLVHKTIDPLLHETVFTNNWRTLLPALATDPNGNRSAVKFDALGRVAATVMMGKVNEPVGDTLDDPTTTITYDLDHIPASVHVAAREEHHFVNGQPAAQAPRWQHAYTYSDGLGREVMKKVLAKPGDAHFVDGNGQLQTRKADPRWIGTGRTVFDNKGHPVKQYEPFFSTTSDYEDEKQLVEWGVTPILRYDPLGRLIRTDHPDGTFSQVVFDAWSQTTRDENDTVLESSWYTRWQNDPGPQGDAARAASKHKDTPTVARLDPLGRPFLTIADNGSFGKYATTLELDIEGRQRSVTDANGLLVLRQDFDMLERTIHSSSPDAGESWLFHDTLGRPVHGWDSLNREQRHDHDELGRVTRLWSTENNVTRLAERTVYGDLHPSGSALNLIGRVFRSFDGAGLVTHERCDFKGNILSTIRQVTISPRAPVDWSSVNTLPDPSALPPAAVALLSTEMFTTTVTYDALNRVKTGTTPDASVTTNSYNAAGLVESIFVNLSGTSDIGFVTGMDYNEKGQRKTVNYGNGVVTTCGYDPLKFRLTNITSVSPTGGLLQNLDYTYDPVGNITHIQDQAQQTIYFANTKVEPNTSYTYDPIYRLISAVGREHATQAAFDQTFSPPPCTIRDPNDSQAMQAYRETYDYDNVGNILTLTHSPLIQGGPMWKRTYTYVPKTNRLATTSLQQNAASQYGHDAVGNMTDMPHLSKLHWNFKNRLSQVDFFDGRSAFYAYDAGGQRVRKVIAKGQSALAERIYVGGYETYREYSGTEITLERQTLHAMDDKSRVALVETKTKGRDQTLPQAVRFQLDNHLGSSVIELDLGAKLISYEEYHPFGTTAYQAMANALEVNPKRYRYTGKERDEESGLNYHRARHYAPWLGRWISADPMGLVDGHNLYSYARNNALRLVDRAGTDSRSAQKDITHLAQVPTKKGVEVFTLPAPIPHQLGTDLPVDSSTIRGGMGTRKEVIAQLRAWAADLTKDSSTINPVETVIDRAVTAYEGQLRAYDARMEAMLTKGLANNLARSLFDRQLGSWFGDEERIVRGYSTGERMISQFRTELGWAARLQGSDPGAQLFGVIARANRTIDPLGAWSYTAAQTLANGIVMRSGFLAGAANQFAARRGWGSPPLTYAQGFAVGAAGKEPLVLGSYTDPTFRAYIKAARLGSTSYLLVDRPNWTGNFNAGLVRGAIEAGRPTNFVSEFSQENLARTYGLEVAQILGTPIQ
jgi:RHS repeat-associated protein